MTLNRPSVWMQQLNNCSRMSSFCTCILCGICSILLERFLSWKPETTLKSPKMARFNKSLRFPVSVQLYLCAHLVSFSRWRLKLYFSYNHLYIYLSGIFLPRCLLLDNWNDATVGPVVTIDNHRHVEIAEGSRVFVVAVIFCQML